MMLCLELALLEGRVILLAEAAEMLARFYKVL
jgi:hypothetical protein